MCVLTVDRRRVVKTLGLAAGGLALTACGGARPAVAPAVAPVRRRGERLLSAVRVSRERVIRTVAGLRPYRPSGFVVRTDVLDGKPVIHNYGHGGGGITLSWGTAHLAVEEAAATGHRECAVLGCGAVGLATARLLQRAGWKVRIYARDLPPRTTSNIAGGQWSPYSVFEPGRVDSAFRGQFARATRLAFRYYQDLVGGYYGVRWIENYYVSDSPIGPATFERQMPELFPDADELAPGEHPFPSAHVRRVTTMLIEPATYLAAMERDVRLAGSEIVVRELHEVSEVVALPEPVVINCTGLGAGALFGDEEIVPVKGQLTVLLPQPEVDYILIHARAALYMMPRGDGILLGGTFDEREWSLDPDERQTERILRGHREYFDRMAHPSAGPRT